MSFVGSASAMSQTIRANRALVKERTTFKEIHERYENCRPTKEYKFKKANPEYIKSLRTRLQKRNRKNTMLKILAFSIITISIGTLLYEVLFAYQL